MWSRVTWLAIQYGSPCRPILKPGFFPRGGIEGFGSVFLVGVDICSHLVCSKPVVRVQPLPNLGTVEPAPLLTKRWKTGPLDLAPDQRAEAIAPHVRRDDRA